jgi:membrane-associated phospholipid phosphatase
MDSGRQRTDLARRARRALLGAGVVGALLALTGFAVYHVPIVQRVDAAILTGFTNLRGHPHVDRLASLIANLCDPSPYVYLCVIPVGMALLRRRRLVAVGILGILAGANLTTELLKPLLAAPRPTGLPAWEITGGTWPSGHATASMTLALCCVLAAPRRWRPYVAAAGAAFAVAVSYSFLTLGWHYPSDALGGFLVASLWTLVGIAAIAAIGARRQAHRPARAPESAAVHEPAAARALAPAAVALGGALLVAALAFLAKPHAVVGYVAAHTSFVVGAAALGALGLTLATGVMLTLLSGSGRDPRAAPRRRSLRD